MHHIKKIVEVKPFKLKLRFNNNEEWVVDLEEGLKSKSQTENSIYKKLPDPNYFATVKLNPEMESILDNGVDFCPDVLYMMAKKSTSNLIIQD